MGMSHIMTYTACLVERNASGAVCCSLLQCIQVRCSDDFASVLQCVVEIIFITRAGPPRANKLQKRTAQQCLQHTATHYNTLSHWRGAYGRAIDTHTHTHTHKHTVRFKRSRLAYEWVTTPVLGDINTDIILVNVSYSIQKDLLQDTPTCDVTHS